MTPLEDHLRQSGIRAPLVVAELLDAQDWTPFEDRYATTGRAPYAPRAMMGLILYGIMQGVSSLRALERLARVDLGAMWVTGGIAPDHANIGRFICFRQRKAMVEPVFSALRQQQGLSRFRRRGLAGVKREFSLHALAYNLARAVALSLCHHLWEWLWGCLGLPYLATKKKIAPPRACVMLSSSHRHRCV